LCSQKEARVTSTPKIEVSGLWYAVGGTEILKGVDAIFPVGRITSVVGPSGAGKSTLLRALNGLVEPTLGEVYLDGLPTSRIDPLALRRRVGMVFQLPTLFGKTVEDTTLYGARLAGKSAEPEGLLEMVGLGASFKDRDPQSLSVGEQQRVSIARALALGPEVLLMDEPTSALDGAARRRIEELIEELNTSLNLTIVLVSHTLDQVQRLAARVVLIAGGRNEGEWSKEEFFSGEGGEQARRFIAGRL
jgi:putative ABC transport system ATP-binding protein